ncbi:MAG: DUF1540 domain-containing protein [Moorella humiferrea]|uniref:DUF1540 domain-containing protein n=1 Tax=Neomoorella humiferrea TaxID=676965 RepID=A0A2T0AMR9_9FIRM|nr:DUF1540 domain-containing protein [Moorella humiferrea]MBE3573669.1 DUF1540 domain-containing protein [Moorella humiferrea]PRR70170.1 hypothetical protein MOHU_19610 [Moorella humiferrea]
MSRIRCEMDICSHHDGTGYCKLDTIRITRNGLDTNCGNFERVLPEGETTTVFSFGRPDDTLETQPYD